MSDELRAAAARAFVCLDLTNLEDDCDEEAIEALAKRAFSEELGHVAALCVWPRFVAQARALVGHRGVRIATVVNFPSGDEDSAEIADVTEAAVTDGADEIDVVIPYRALLEGRDETVSARVQRVKRAAGPEVTIKAILETGLLQTDELIARAGELAITGGADFLKTSTGKAPVNATLRAARVMLETIRDTDADHPIGFKAAGGLRTTQDAANYLEVADEVMGPDWATPETFRIGASSLLDALKATLNKQPEPTAKEDY